jgi:glycine oxidase
MSRRAVVVGGGIIGLASAWRLALAGWRVVLLDAAPEAREASWAAAGMLAPHHEAEAPGPLWRLGVASLARWPRFAHELGGASAIDYRDEGGLLPALDADDAQEVERKRAFLSAAGIANDWLDHAALERAEPALATTCSGALLLPAAQANPRLTCDRLRAACAATGVDLRFATPVAGMREGSVLTAAGERLVADEVVLASGAWTPDLARLAGLDLAGEPVKGQMLRLEADDALLRRFVHCHHAYLVPRRGQGVVVGSTMVWSGFARDEDPAAIARLATEARRLVPALADAAILERWTGLRPRLASGLPVIARVRPGLILATGHFRNGVLLTPITAAAVECIAGAQLPPCDMEAFSCPPCTPP